MARLEFGEDFAWGVATSAYQIEGAWSEDGRGEGIWDRFAHAPHHILSGATGDVACDHYRRMAQDVALLKRALDRLPSDKKELLVLARFQDMKYEEIASLLGCEVGTVKVRVFRAMRALEEIYHTLSKERTA